MANGSFILLSIDDHLDYQWGLRITRLHTQRRKISRTGVRSELLRSDWYKMDLGVPFFQYGVKRTNIKLFSNKWD